MSGREAEILVIGAGAAGIAAGRRLQDGNVEALVVEARSRPGGRAWTLVTAAGEALDLGCGWLHSADRNPWTTIAAEQGRRIDRLPPPWSRDRAHVGPHADKMGAFGQAIERFRDDTDVFADRRDDVAAAALVPSTSPWRPLIDAVSTYYSGAPLERVSARDLARYDDSGVNWRVADGLGTAIAAHARPLRIEYDCEVTKVDHGGSGVVLHTSRGTLRAKVAIVTVSSDILAQRTTLFAPALPAKTGAAAALPLGLANKLYLALPADSPLETDTRAFGSTNAVDTGAYHFRPMGRPIIEAYFGGDLAERLEEGGTPGFFDFACAELKGLFGADFAAGLSPLASTAWRRDPWARGAYSYARPGRAEEREVLAAPVDDKIFFAGEACSPTDFSTAHGAYLTGVRAAEAAIATLRAGAHRSSH